MTKQNAHALPRHPPPASHRPNRKTHRAFLATSILRRNSWGKNANTKLQLRNHSSWNVFQVTPFSPNRGACLGIKRSLQRSSNLLRRQSTSSLSGHWATITFQGWVLQLQLMAYTIKERLENPVFEPASESEKDGCEDPRISEVEGQFVMTYTAL